MGYSKINYSKLRGKIREVFKTEKRFAEMMGISRVTLYYRLNNKGEWSIFEMEKACSLLGIPLENIREYFFTELV